MLRRQR